MVELITLGVYMLHQVGLLAALDGVGVVLREAWWSLAGLGARAP